MARDFAQSFYKSRRWKNARAAYIKSKGGLCERCLAKGIYRPADMVHHIVHLTEDNINDPSITLAWSNFQALCFDCHEQVHRKQERRYTIDRDGVVRAK